MIINLKCKCNATYNVNLENTCSGSVFIDILNTIKKWMEDHRRCMEPTGMLVLEKGQKFEPLKYNTISNCGPVLEGCPPIDPRWSIKEIHTEPDGLIKIILEFFKKR